METGQTLIDIAAESCGGLRRLADRIGEDAGFLSKMRTGKRPISPGIAARMAVIAGLDARRAALDALVAQEHDPAKQQELARLFDVEMPSPPALLVHGNL